MTECIFCLIASKKLDAKIAHEDEHIVAFHDIMPKAPIHLLVIPKQHYASLHEAQKDPRLLGEMLTVAARLAESLGLSEPGYRVVINTGDDGGQTVDHLHLHLLAGRTMQWPPG